MTELEDLLREELSARAQSADVAGEMDRVVGLMTGVQRRISGRRQRHRITASVSSAIAMIAAVAIALAAWPGGSGQGPGGPAGGSSPRGTVPLSDPSLTPPGWSPVSYQEVQLSVPSRWSVQNAQGQGCASGAGGVVYLGIRVNKPQPGLTCKHPANVISIAPLTIPFPTVPRTNGLINGFPVIKSRRRYGAAQYAVPGLAVLLTLRGPLAGRVLATLTRSPLSVVDARGPAFAVPPDWRWHDFGGIAFAAPAAWRLTRDDWWGGCGYGVAAATVLLSTARMISAAHCLLVPPTAGYLAGRPGVVVGAGRYARPASGSLAGRDRGSCVTLHGVRACQESALSTSALLVLAVYPPAGARPITVEIGLSGTGLTARTILDSIRPAAGRR